MAASLVIISHQYGLMGLGEPVVFGGFSYGGLGVVIFFSLSGYLVSQSWDRDPHFARFFLKRGLRIFPGLICVTLLMAFVMGPLVTTLPAHEYFSRKNHLWEFVLTTASAFNMSDALPGVFQTNHIKTINSSLWTIPAELKWYWFLALFGLFGVMRSRFALPVTFLVLAVCRFLLPIEQAHHVLLELGLSFLFGATMHICREDIQRYRHFIAPTLGCAAVVVWLLQLPYFGLILAVPYLVVTFGEMSTPVLRGFGRFGDLSYGLYIYAFPIQQWLIYSSGNTHSFARNLAAPLSVYG